MARRAARKEGLGCIATDVDYTLHSDSVFRIVMAQAMLRGVIEPPSNYNPDIGIIPALLQTLPAAIAGRRTNMFDGILRDLPNLVTPKLHESTTHALAAAHKAGRYIVLVSQSPQSWVEAFARGLRRYQAPVHIVFGSELVAEGGTYTGGVRPLKKATAVSTLAALSCPIHMAMGDTETDQPLIDAARRNKGKSVVIGNTRDEHLLYHAVLHARKKAPPIVEPDIDGKLWLCEGPITPHTPDTAAYTCAQRAITEQEFLGLLGLAGAS